jgi:Domain of unknown function (DUF5710)
MVGDKRATSSTMPASAGNHFADGAGLPGKIYLEVPFEQNEAAKAAGLRWDSTIRKWYAADEEIAEAFSCRDQVGAPAMMQTDSLYFKVPFLQKDRAKALGMRFDGIRKLWFAPNRALAVDAARIFERIIEELDNNV